jgi:hypothetical protein
MDGEGRERRLVGGWREDETSLVESSSAADTPSPSATRGGEEGRAALTVSTASSLGLAMELLALMFEFIVDEIGCVVWAMGDGG